MHFTCSFIIYLLFFKNIPQCIEFFLKRQKSMSIKRLKPLSTINANNVHEFILEKLEITENGAMAPSLKHLHNCHATKNKITKMKECAIRQLKKTILKWQLPHCKIHPFSGNEVNFGSRTCLALITHTALTWEKVTTLFFIVYFGPCCANYIEMIFCLGAFKWES